MKKKKVLLISYLFPPIGGSGVQRMLKMAKYLGRYGCEVSVLTVKDPQHVLLDDSLFQQLPGDVGIYRAAEMKLPGVSIGAPALSSAEQKNSNSSNKINISSLKEKAFLKAKPFLKKVKEAILIPDDQIIWYRQAVKLGEKIVREEGIDCIVSSSGPYTNHLVGREIKRRTNVYWIADFRDPWTQNMHRPTMKYRLQREEMMEKTVIEESDILLTVTHSFAKNFNQKYGEKIKRLEVIHNGFDPEDFLELEKERLYPDKWTFVYTGILYAQRNPRLFIEAVAELINEGVIDRKKISIQFAGVFDYPGYSDNKDAVDRLNLQDVVHVWGNLPHQKALSLLAGADQLLLIGDVTEDSGAYIPGKLYEYIAVKKPIFALTVEGESSRIIRENNLGKIISPFDKEELKRELKASYENWISGKSEIPSSRELRQYQRDEQAKMLAEIIKQINE